MIMTVTELGMAQRCDWQWLYGSFNGRALTKIMPAVALSLGKLIHAAHAAWELNPTGTLYLLFVEEAEKELARIRQSYKERVGANVSDSELEKFYDLVTLGREMCVNYQDFYGTPLPADFRVIQPEQTIVIDVPGSEHTWEYSHAFNQWLECPHEALTLTRLEPLTGKILQYTVPPCNGYHQLEGTLDSLIQNSDGLCYIRERKTYDKRPTVLSLQRNDQFLGYIWMEQRLNEAAPFQIVGIAYDGMWKRTKVDKRGKERTYQDLFMQTLLTRSQYEVNQYGLWLPRRIFKKAGYFQQPNRRPTEIDAPTLEPNRTWMGCWDCMHEELCSAEMCGEDLTGVLKDYTLRSTEDRADLWPDIAAAIMEGG